MESGRTENKKETDLARDLEVASTMPGLPIADMLCREVYGLDNVLLVPLTFQHVARGEGDGPVAALEVSYGVVLARELDHFRCVGEGRDRLSLGGFAHYRPY